MSDKALDPHRCAHEVERSTVRWEWPRGKNAAGPQKSHRGPPLRTDVDRWP